MGIELQVDQQATIEPVDPALTSMDFTYTSSDSSKVTVDASGLITAIASGQAAVTCVRNADNTTQHLLVTVVTAAQAAAPPPSGGLVTVTTGPVPVPTFPLPDGVSLLTIARGPGDALTVSWDTITVPIGSPGLNQFLIMSEDKTQYNIFGIRITNPDDYTISGTDVVTNVPGTNLGGQSPPGIWKMYIVDNDQTGALGAVVAQTNVHFEYV